MKQLFILLAFFIGLTPQLLGQSSPSTSNPKVLVCVSTTAEKYHSYRCGGLNKCTHTVETVLKSEAINMGRTPCKICYSNGSTAAPTPINPPGTIKPTPPPSGSGCSAVQCSGTTQKGLRCKNRTTNCNGRCYHH